MNKIIYDEVVKKSEKIYWDHSHLIEPSHVDCLYVSKFFPNMERNNFQISVDEENIFNGVCDDVDGDNHVYVMWKNCTSFVYDGYLHLGLIDENSEINVKILDGAGVNLYNLNYKINDLSIYKPKFLVLFQKV